jgi:hypothetical protein
MGRRVREYTPHAIRARVKNPTTALFLRDNPIIFSIIRNK